MIDHVEHLVSSVDSIALLEEDLWGAHAQLETDFILRISIFVQLEVSGNGKGIHDIDSSSYDHWGVPHYRQKNCVNLDTVLLKSDK